MNPYVNLERLRENWHELLRPFDVDEAAAAALFNDIIAHYEGDGRFYHNLEHIQNVLGFTLDMRDQAKDLTAIQLAAWFHDVIYHPQATDNEEKSAAYAVTALKQLDGQIPPALIETVRQLVLATKTHQVPADDGDGRILIDADLATLASPQEQYDRYTNAIRQEYGDVPESVYRPTRAALLNRFLQRQRIFLTDEMFASRENPARRNMEREIRELEGHGE